MFFKGGSDTSHHIDIWTGVFGIYHHTQKITICSSHCKSKTLHITYKPTSLSISSLFYLRAPQCWESGPIPLYSRHVSFCSIQTEIHKVKHPVLSVVINKVPSVVYQSLYMSHSIAQFRRILLAHYALCIQLTSPFMSFKRHFGA